MSNLPKDFIRINNVSRRFQSADSEVVALNNVSLDIPQGQFTAIVGRSGSGKTTLLNIIAGLDTADEGSVDIDGQQVSNYSDRQQTEFRRRTIGFVFQSFGLLPLLSAAENSDLSLRIAGAGMRDRQQRTS